MKEVGVCRLIVAAESRQRKYLLRKDAEARVD
jgi:hypothetical protein